MAQLLTEPAQEEGTYAITFTFTDEDGDPVTPNSATWTLSDFEGNIINSRENVTITALASSKTIVLSGADLAISDETGVKRTLTVEGLYNSTLGNNLPFKKEVNFRIEQLTNVP